ncbi:MAG TPA: PilN domain-containing protein [Acidobacteriaceae bacterium]|nr:PilN domain-containing protein [Acidobacteriaceae bacterium]
MKITINLATRPFVELRPLFARLRLAMFGLAALAIGLGIWLHAMNRHAQVAQAQMDSLKAQTAAFEMERSNNERRMLEPQNQAVLNRSQFLNDLFLAKSFSWTSVMTDLERVLPTGVQVTSIDPAISPEHEVTIRLRVSGDRERVVDLVRNLERSQRFLAPRPANESAQTHEAGQAIRVSQVAGPDGVQFEIVSGYNPLPVPSGVGVKDGSGGGAAVDAASDSDAKRGVR